LNRRKFIQNTSLSGIGIAAATVGVSCSKETKENAVAPVQISESKSAELPIVIATWDVPKATAKAWEVLQEGKTALDAVEQGVMIEEADEKNLTVGKGGLPDRDGKVTLDACIMNSNGDYGAVLAMEDITHAISVARKVMEETPHAILAGEGARKFAIESGFTAENLLTETSKKEWEKWKEKSEYKPIINIENHDTVGMLAMDKNGDISGACTTSGMAYKMRGRVGDSAIIGSGLFIDNDIGGATATGLGEEVLKTVGSFLIVELMRQGKSPQEACEEAIRRIVKKNKNYKNFQVGYIAMNKKGEVGFYSIQEWFSCTIYQNGENRNVKSDFYHKPKD
jgi:N4-(beta-N-acetylglucosaminyl)-L-asparaginase